MSKRITIFFMLSFLLNLFGCTEQSNKNQEISNKDKDSSNKQILKSVEDFKNRPIYSILTMQILDTTSKENLEQTVIDNIYKKINSDSINKHFDIISSLSKVRQAIFSTIGLESEVDNGGFNQYFYNFSSSGQYAELARDGFKLIGAIKHAELTQRAIDTLLKHADQYKKFKDGTKESFSKSYENNPLNKLDDIFYDLDKTENLSALRVTYIEKHKEEFIDQ